MNNMLKRLNKISDNMFNNWEQEKHFLEMNIKKNNVVKNSMFLNFVFGVLCLYNIYSNNHSIFTIYGLIIIGIILVGFYIDNTTNLILKYVYLSLQAFLFSFNLFTLIVYAQYFWEFSNFRDPNFSVFALVLIILLSITPYFSYNFAVKIWMKRLNVEQNEKNSNKFMYIIYAIPGSAGALINYLLENNLSREIYNIISEIIAIYIIVLFIFGGFLFLYNAYILIVNEKKII